MNTVKALTPFYAVTDQLQPGDIGTLAAASYRTIINNRPDGEAEDQPTSADLEAAARRHGLAYHHLPVQSGRITDADVDAFAEILAGVRGPVLAFCRTGTRSTTLWALHEAHHLAPQAILAACSQAGYELDALLPRLEARWSRAEHDERTHRRDTRQRYDVAIVGGGAGGCAAAASLLARRRDLRVAIIEPREDHYYQPGWTLVGGGVFDRRHTRRAMADAIPEGAKWIRAAVATFDPEHDQIVLEDGERISYRVLIAAPGIKLEWDRIEGLSDTLGRNGVTSNYRFDMAAYTWELVQGLTHGKALFTQPPMPIKCAGAPQKAMYLACDHWRRRGVLDNVDVEFDTAGAVLFGVSAFVPPLMRYVERYGVDLAFNSNLVAVDGPARKAWFDVKQDDREKTVEKSFDMLHVCPPQAAPDFVRHSPLANDAGWIEVDAETLRHARYGNVFALGDACSAPNAKTAAAVRKQAPVVAENTLATLDGHGLRAVYDGYGSCPLTVERGRVVLAEFGYGGKLLPTFPLDPRVPRRSMWWLKERMMPRIYFDLMLQGREWLARPSLLPYEPAAHEAKAACDYTGQRR
ncbi:TIGR01244 family sulfur transferase [Arhodomonas sp. AD133]|uniref:TIGR01244 family sulfur transferase n=1 Tax=Arhodomonas sp. AD133 TaxID=3415009 RepID=UPI003EBBF7FA